MTQGVRRKQVTTQAEWLHAWEHAETLMPAAKLDALVTHTLNEMRKHLKGRKVAFAWSGGKDSLVIEYLMQRLGHERCVLAMTNLEYPEFLEWVTNHMPPGLSVVNTGQDLAWLAAHPDMLFPQTAALNAKWFRLVQHTAQRRYFKANGLDTIVLGRRLAEGNYCGTGGLYTDQHQVLRYSPIRDWTHEAVLALLKREGYSLPPIYGYPRGFQVGTGNWAQRLYTSSTNQGFDETWQIDPDIVRAAADVLPQARDYLYLKGLN